MNELNFLVVVSKFIEDESIAGGWFVDYQEELVTVASDYFNYYHETNDPETTISISDFFRSALAKTPSLYLKTDVASLALLYCYSAIEKFKKDPRNQLAARLSKIELINRYERIYKKIVEDEIREMNDNELNEFLNKEGAWRVLSVLYLEYRVLKEYVVGLAMRGNPEYNEILISAKIVEQFRTPEKALMLGQKFDKLLYQMCLRYSSAFSQ